MERVALTAWLDMRGKTKLAPNVLKITLETDSCAVHVLLDRCLKTTDRFAAVRRVMDGNGTPAGMDPVKHALQTSSKTKNNVLA